MAAVHKKKPQFILAERECRETLYFEKTFLKTYKKKPEIVMRVASWEVIANLVAEGLGIGYLPDFVADYKKGLIKEYALDFEPLSYRIMAIFPNGMRLRKSSELFLSYLN